LPERVDEKFMRSLLTKRLLPRGSRSSDKRSTANTYFVDKKSLARVGIRWYAFFTNWHISSRTDNLAACFLTAAEFK